jgi:pimeloyl-ACP methyl ester carboxylesterase
MSHATQTVSQLTAPTLTVEAGTGVTYAYRRFGRRDDRWPPLLFLQHFRGNLDNWDPVLVDTIAAHREVILLDNTGVGLSSGTVPVTVTEMARDAIAFVDALEIDRIDLLGYSLGGMVAQEFALLRPRVVRRIVLAGTGPRGGQQMHGWIVDIERTLTRRTTASRIYCTSSSRSPRPVGRSAANTSSAPSAARRVATSRTVRPSRVLSTTRSSNGASRTRADSTGLPGLPNRRLSRRARTT